MLAPQVLPIREQVCPYILEALYLLDASFLCCCLQVKVLWSIALRRASVWANHFADFAGIKSIPGTESGRFAKPAMCEHGDTMLSAV